MEETLMGKWESSAYNTILGYYRIGLSHTVTVNTLFWYVYYDSLDRFLHKRRCKHNVVPFNSLIEQAPYINHMINTDMLLCSCYRVLSFTSSSTVCMMMFFLSCWNVLLRNTWPPKPFPGDINVYTVASTWEGTMLSLIHATYPPPPSLLRGLNKRRQGFVSIWEYRTCHRRGYSFVDIVILYMNSFLQKCLMSLNGMFHPGRMASW